MEDGKRRDYLLLLSHQETIHEESWLHSSPRAHVNAKHFDLLQLVWKVGNGILSRLVNTVGPST